MIFEFETNVDGMVRVSILIGRVIPTSLKRDYVMVYSLPSKTPCNASLTKDNRSDAYVLKCTSTSAIRKS